MIEAVAFVFLFALLASRKLLWCCTVVHIFSGRSGAKPSFTLGRPHDFCNACKSWKTTRITKNQHNTVKTQHKKACTCSSMPLNLDLGKSDPKFCIQGNLRCTHEFAPDLLNCNQWDVRFMWRHGKMWRDFFCHPSNQPASYTHCIWEQVSVGSAPPIGNEWRASCERSPTREHPPISHQTCMSYLLRTCFSDVNVVSDDHMHLFTVQTGPCFEIRRSYTQKYNFYYQKLL